MEEVLHILSLLKQQAEAQLAVKTNRNNDALARIKSYSDSIIMRGQEMSARENMQVYEQWCVLQQQNIAQIKSALPILDQDIRNSFLHLQTVQAKVTAAESLDVKERRETALKAEAAEEDAMLELSLLKRAYSKA